MTSTSDTPSAGGVSEPDWIDQILSRATEEVEARSAAKPAPSVAESAVAPRAATPQSSATPSTSGGDELGEIRWFDDHTSAPGTKPMAAPQLDRRAVGRATWDEELASIGDSEPEGWDKLSWQDLDEDDSKGSNPLGKPSGFGSLIREWGPVLFASVAIALFTRLVLVQAYHIPSESMVPTLEDGDRVVVNRLSYQFGEVERGQVVVFAKPQGTEGENDLIKRIVGLPGETIRFVDNEVFVDGFLLEEPYLAAQDSTRPRIRIPGCDQRSAMPDTCRVPDDSVFVMGDNRLGSSDSRVFGPIPTESIVGRAFLRVWPLNHLGEL